MDLSYFDGAPRTFDENFKSTCAFIWGLISQWQEFYIGITGRLAFDHRHKNRWTDDGHGHCWKGFVKLIPLYSSPNAHKYIWDGTGKLEDDLLDVFGTLPGCHNKGKGGGGASKTKPHFTYIVVGNAHMPLFDTTHGLVLA